MLVVGDGETTNQPSGRGTTITDDEHGQEGPNRAPLLLSCGTGRGWPAWNPTLHLDCSHTALANMGDAQTVETGTGLHKMQARTLLAVSSATGGAPIVTVVTHEFTMNP